MTPKRNRNDPICFSPYLYRARNRVERFFNRIKQCRRVATRYDKVAANYLAFVQFARTAFWSLKLLSSRLNLFAPTQTYRRERFDPDIPPV